MAGSLRSENQMPRQVFSPPPVPGGAKSGTAAEASAKLSAKLKEHLKKVHGAPRRRGLQTKSVGADGMPSPRLIVMSRIEGQVIAFKCSDCDQVFSPPLVPCGARLWTPEEANAELSAKFKSHLKTVHGVW
jgi:predicted small metal-binding protein